MNLSEEVRLLALDTLTGGWFRYGKLSDGVQIRCTWQQEGPVRWLQVENLETGEKNLFTLDVTVTQRPAPTAAASKGPQCSICGRPLGQLEDPDSVDCGGDCLACMREEEGNSVPRAELTEADRMAELASEEEEPIIPDLRPGWRKLLDPVWVDMPPVTAADIPAECANCAPLAAGASATRVDGTEPGEPCEDCRLTYPWTWAEVRAGDEVQGEDGAWYDVVRSDPSALGTLYRSIQVVTLLIGDREHTYDMPGMGSVRIKLGEEHRAIRNLKAGFPGTEEVR